MSELGEWLGTATTFAIQAGALLMEGWRRGPAIQKKSDIDLVTEFDLRSEELLRARIGEAFPEHGLVAEEGADEPSGELVWYVDPLDGTTNFAHGHFVFAVSIGLARGDQPILGVVHAPAIGTTWAGAEGLGATRNGQPCHVSSASELSESVVATGFPYHRAKSDDNNVAEVSRLAPSLRGLRRCGAAAVDLCLVADGTYDGYWEQGLQPWDVCAGLAIARAAGARATDYRGRPADARSGRLIVTNGELHAPLAAAVASARRTRSFE